MNNEMEQLSYPIGRYNEVKKNSATDIEAGIHVLEQFPSQLVVLVKNLSREQLNSVYRPKGWTVRQVIHHIADSHHHSYTRFKWALTEDTPLIKVYEEKEWSKLFDAETAPIELSLNYIIALHAKLVYLLRGLSAAQLMKKYVHPDGNIDVSVAENIRKYAWHSQHHYAHIENLIVREGW